MVELKDCQLGKLRFHSCWTFMAQVLVSCCSSCVLEVHGLKARELLQYTLRSFQFSHFLILALEILFFYSADNQKSFKPSLSNQTPTLLHISACVCHAMSSLCMAPGPRPSVLLMLLIWEFAPVSATALLSSLCLLGLSPCQLCRSCCHSQVQTIIPTLHTSGIIVRIKGVIYVMKVL